MALALGLVTAVNATGTVDEVPPRRRQARGVRTRQRIMTAAAELFAHGGYDATSVQAVAERAEITVAAIYRHFRSKDDLLIAVAKAALTNMDLNEIGAETDDPAQKVTDLVVAYTQPDYYLTRRLVIELSQAAARHPEVAGALEHFHATARQGLAAVLAAGQADGRIATAVDPEMLARTILVLIMGLTHIDTLDPRLATNQAWLASLRRDVRLLLTHATT
jgi:AcrR family transcriptional regulator